MKSTKFYRVSYQKTLLAMEQGAFVTFTLEQAQTVRCTIQRLKKKGCGDWSVSVKNRTNTLVQRIK